MRALLLPVAALLGIQLAQGQDLKNGVTGIFVRKAEIVEVVDTDLLREFTVGDSLLGLRLIFRRYLNACVLKPSPRTAFFEVHYDTSKTALLCQCTHTPALPLPGPGGFTGAQDVLTYFFKMTNNEILPVALRPEEVLAALGPAHAEALTTYTHQQQLNLE